MIMMKFLFFILCFFVFSCDSSDDGGNGGSGSTVECGDGICDESETETTCAEDCQTTIACSDDTQGFCENPQYVGNDNQYECLPCEFIYSSSVQLGYYIFKEVKIDNQQIDADDWVGAFNGDVCVGSRMWDTSLCGEQMCDLPVFGNDQTHFTSGYMENGDIPTFKIYDSSENSYIDAFSSGIILNIPNEDPVDGISWSNNIVLLIDLLSASSSPFNFTLEETGAATLFIFEGSITELDVGDQIALFDTAGIIDNTGAIGEVLVGHGIWEGNQLEITTVESADLTDFEGPILPGYIPGNTMILKVWDASEQLICSADYTASFGSGSFNGLFTNINSITLVCD